MTLLQQAAGLLGGVLYEGFSYNRENFLYDRKQRQLMEYQLAEMRMKQVELWREDVRDSIELAPKKMEVYLLVIALELNATAVALCKARVPAGVPSWLAACHTLAICSAFTYLIMGLWFGLQAFVSAQAYKVRILTQLVRLPVPTWQALEASRTYASSFETVGKGQMLRVPFMLGTQESRLPAVREQPDVMGPMASSFGDAGETPASDPWGLERPAEGLAEVRPEVNQQVEKQRHVWLIREAARFYQTYDAFCRISLSAGTSSLAQFFAFFCLTYVLTETGAPIAAWAGMIVFNGVSIMFMRIDLMLHGYQYLFGILLLIISPVLCGVVCYVSSKRAGDAGKWEMLMPVALFARGAWFIYYLWLFRVREVQNGMMLPMAFKAVLYLDPFAWAKHSGTWFRQLRASLTTRRTANFPVGGRPPVSDSMLPSMQCMSASAPRRPEEVQAAAGVGEAVGANVSFRPRTFATVADDDDGDGPGEDQSGADIHGEKPGLVPWRYFFMNTFAVACMWWAAAVVETVNAVQGHAGFVTGNYASLAPGEVAPLPSLIGVKVETSWYGPMPHPQGLACDPLGHHFATVGRVSDGRRAILHGRLPLSAESVRFKEAPPCQGLEDGQQQAQDLTLHGCGEPGGCSALVLPRFGRSLVSCPLAAPELLQSNATRQLHAMPLARSWLEDRGGASLDGSVLPGGLLQPEELASLAAVPCGGGLTGALCAIVGTTARRVVQLVAKTDGGSGSEWVPKRVVKKDHGEVPGPGAFALLGGRYLATLHRIGSRLRVTDLLQGGRSIGSWSLPGSKDKKGRRWASICGGGNAIFALEDNESPSLWRFSLPSTLQEL